MNNINYDKVSHKELTRDEAVEIFGEEVVENLEMAGVEPENNADEFNKPYTTWSASTQVGEGFLHIAYLVDDKIMAKLTDAGSYDWDNAQKYFIYY